MTDLLRLIFAVLASLFKSRVELEAENLVLRQQVNVLRRRMPKRPALTNVDRLLFVWLHHWFPSTAATLAIVRPETVIRWHRVGFAAQRGQPLPLSFIMPKRQKPPAKFVAAPADALSLLPQEF